MNSIENKTIYPRRPNIKKIFYFILISFGFSWSVLALLFFFGVSLESQLGRSVASIFYMYGPAIATYIVVKSIYKDSFYNIGWSFSFNKLKWYLRTIFIFITFITLVFLLIFVFGNIFEMDVFGFLDISNEGFDRNFKNYILENITIPIEDIPFLPGKVLFPVFILQGILLGITLYVPLTFGEEFGWRGLLLYEWQSLGFLKSSLFIGVIWGLWHAPLILYGYNFPNQPFTGLVVMCIFTSAVSPLFTYVRLKTKSILGAAMFHGMINSTAVVFILYVSNGNPLFNSMVGLCGIIASLLIICGIYFWDRNFIENFKILK